MSIETAATPATPTTSATDTPRFARGFLSAMAGSLALVAAINVLGNGNDLFSTALSPAQTDRAWKARRLEAAIREGAAPRVLILGSSRMMQINPDLVERITGRPALNLAVPAGNVMDSLAFFRLAIASGARPELIVMNVDEGMLVNYIQAPLTLGLSGHRGLLRALPSRDAAAILARTALHIDQTSTTNSLARLIDAYRGHHDPAADRIFRHGERNVVLLPNGYRINPPRARARQRGVFDLGAELRLDLGPSEANASPIASLKPDTPAPAFDQRLVGHLRTLLDEAKAMGIAMKVVTTPEHPRTAGTPVGANRDHLHGALVDLLKVECARYGAVYKDFSRLDAFDGEPEEFWDSTHQAPRNMARMTNALFDLPPDRDLATLPTDAEILDRVIGPEGRDANADASGPPARLTSAAP